MSHSPHKDGQKVTQISQHQHGRTFWIPAKAGMTRVALLSSLFRDTTLAASDESHAYSCFNPRPRAGGDILTIMTGHTVSQGKARSASSPRSLCFVCAFRQSVHYASLQNPVLLERVLSALWFDVSLSSRFWGSLLARATI